MATSTAVTNTQPMASAGSNVEVSTKANTCDADVVLDGSGSSDPQNNITNYWWSGAGRSIGADVLQSVTLEPGVHDIELEVVDAVGSPSVDTVKVTVRDQVAPEAACADVQIACSGVSTPVTTSCSATDACDATPALTNDALAQYPVGVHNYNCRAEDDSNNIDVDSCTITVADLVGPMFTLVPPDITISSCNTPDIGTAVATDDCGNVSVSNDAPAVFPLGETVVTWAALDAGNNQITATQSVTVVLGDDPSCCPAGTNVVLGTPGDDDLDGTPGPDCIIGLGGDDDIDAGDGDDFISGGAGEDSIEASGGDN